MYLNALSCFGVVEIPLHIYRGFQVIILYESFVLYMENKAPHDGSRRLTTERTGTDKDTSEQQLKNMRNHQSLVKKKLELSIKGAPLTFFMIENRSFTPQTFTRLENMSVSDNKKG